MLWFKITFFITLVSRLFVAVFIILTLELRGKNKRDNIVKDMPIRMTESISEWLYISNADPVDIAIPIILNRVYKDIASFMSSFLLVKVTIVIAAELYKALPTPCVNLDIKSSNQLSVQKYNKIDTRDIASPSNDTYLQPIKSAALPETNLNNIAPKENAPINNPICWLVRPIWW